MDAKLCLHSKKEAPRTIFNDLSQNSKLAKDYEAMLFKRKDTKFNAVVEYCFSGMRFKVRLEGENCLLALSLVGVKTLSADKNQPALAEYAHDALSFAKDHLFQRDVQVELYSADKKGNFFGTVTTPSKHDFSLKLVEEGLAQCYQHGSERRMPPNYEQICEMERQAKAKELGIWSRSLKLVSQNKAQQQENKFAHLERVTGEMSSLTDGRSFHLRIFDKNYNYEKIDNLLANFNPSTAEQLEKPILKGTLCAAKYAADGKWYRAKVV